MNGVVIIDKPCGKTSHDVVAMLRKRFKTRRVGHTGTLDPMATGVLPVCIGNATKASDMLTESDKHYEAEFELGKKTDTLDITGEVINTGAVEVSEADVISVIKSFIGKQKQLPPMYSAIKQGGKKLYELAREGIEVERQPRDIEIYSIEIIFVRLPNVRISVHCSKGTYIRSLCDDIGERLGCGAVMTALRRTEAAGFKIDNSYTIEALDELDDITSALISTDALFSDLPEIHLNEKQEKSILNGVRMTWRNGEEGMKYRIYGHDGRFLCISQIKTMQLHLVKSFWT